MWIFYKYLSKYAINIFVGLDWTDHENLLNYTKAYHTEISKITYTDV